MGLDQKIGSLEAGKQADIAVISVANISQQPIYDIEAALVFASNARDVSMTMVAGVEIYRAIEPRNLLETDIRNGLKSIKAKIT
jgi:5-methylthioadenosine/S-adenosylhomocysteine deaminase